MADNKEITEIRTILKELRKKRRRMVFIGCNYEKDEPILNALKESVEKVKVNDKSFIPIVAKDIFEEIDPTEIHEESLRLLHNCGFAIIDITNPAGQLMELERARDYGVITFVIYSREHPSKMPITLSKVMEDRGIGYLVEYDNIDGLKKFVKSILTINYLKEKSPKEVIKKVIAIPNKFILLTSIGVIGSGSEEIKDNEIKSLLNEFEEKVIITGWDFKTRGKKEAEKYNFRYILCENCILYKKSNNQFNQIECFCDGESLNLVKEINRNTIHAILKYAENNKIKPVVFFSQGNEKAVCYYLNPPEKIREELEKYKEDKTCETSNFIKEVKKLCGTGGKKKGNLVEFPKPSDPQSEASLLYAIEKVNAKHRTFHPYSINLQNDKISVNLKPAENYKEFSYKDVENIVEKVLDEMKNRYEQIYNKIVPQKDICIDIFCKSKDEILNSLLNKIGDENTLFVYLSKGTESDIPMIFKGYSSKYEFIALGNDDISERLKRAGVIPFGKSIKDVLKNFSDLMKER